MVFQRLNIWSVIYNQYNPTLRQKKEPLSQLWANNWVYCPHRLMFVFHYEKERKIRHSLGVHPHSQWGLLFFKKDNILNIFGIFWKNKNNLHKCPCSFLFALLCCHGYSFRPFPVCLLFRAFCCHSSVAELGLLAKDMHGKLSRSCWDSPETSSFQQ